VSVVRRVLVWLLLLLLQRAVAAMPAFYDVYAACVTTARQMMDS